jgi:WD40 repeat protein
VNGLAKVLGALVLAPDNTWLAVLPREADREVVIVDVRRAKVLTRLPLECHGAQLALSPDGRSLVVGDCGGGAHVWRTKRWKKISSITLPSRELVTGLAVSPDQKQLAVSDVENAIYLYSFPALTNQRLLLRHSACAQCLAWTRDGKALLAGDDKGVVSCLDVATGRTLWRVKGRGEVNDLVLSPDGQSLAVAYWEPFLFPDSMRIAKATVAYVRIWDVRSRRQLWGFTGYECAAGHVTFSPDGKVLATSDHVGNILLQPLGDMGGPKRHRKE